MPYLNNIKYKSSTVPFGKISKLGVSAATVNFAKVDKISTKEVKVQPKNLDVTRTYSNVEYIWSTDFLSCSASAIQGGTEENITENGTVTVLKTIQPTHGEDGSITYAAEFTKKPFELQIKVKTIPASGHNYGTPTYTWNDEGTVCTAKRVCDDDSAFEEEVGTMTYTVEEATCTENGRKTATATFLNTAFATQTNDYEIIPSLGGHDFNDPTYVWSDDNQDCVATRICKNNSSHKEIEDAVVTPSVKIAATCTAMGTTTYTAKFNNTAFATQIKDAMDIAALGHDIVNHVCTRCGYTEYVPGLFDSNGNQLIGLTATHIQQDNVGYNIPSSWIS